MAICSAVLVVFTAVITIAANEADPNSSSNSIRSSGANGTFGPPPVLAGNQGRVLNFTMTCPFKSDLQGFDTRYMQALNVHGTAGQQNAINTAHQAGCETIAPGLTGMVIDNFGSAAPLDKLTLSDDREAFWFNAEEIWPLNYTTGK